jgi:hypothetical protein
MRSIQHRYALGFNRRRGLLGPVWQSRYQAKLVLDQRYFDQLMVYIHLNPVMAGEVGDPADHRWSGHREILGMGKNPVIDLDAALMGFGSTLRSARARYLKTLKGAIESRWVGDRVEKLPWWRVDDDRELQAVDRGPYVDVLGRSTGLDRPALSAAQYVEAAARWLRAEIVALAGRGRQAKTVRQRELLAVVGVERYGVQVKVLAEVLGKSRVTVSSWVRRGAARRAASESFREDLDALDRALAEDAT